MKKQSYNERVQALAEKMARAELPDMYIKERGINYFIKKYTSNAQIAVEEMAEQFNNGWSCGVLHANNNDGYKRDDCLKRLGLIQDEKEVSNDL